MIPQPSKKQNKLIMLLLGPKMRYKANTVILVISVIAIVVMINIILTPQLGKIDLTKDRFYTLSDATYEFLKRLDQQIKITAFFPQGDPLGEVVQDLLDEYRRISPRIEYEFIDPDKMPSVAKQYDITAYGTSVVEVGQKSRKVMEYELLDYDTPGDMANFQGEQAFTRALINLFSEDENYIYFSIGHGERSLSTDYFHTKTFLEGEGYIIKTINISTAGYIPENADIFIVAGPRKDLSKEDIHVVENYLDRGGKVIIALDPPTQNENFTNLKKMLSCWGIGVNDDLVIDLDSHYFLDTIGLIPVINPHPVTERIIEKDLSLFFPRSRSLYHTKEKGIEFIKTSSVLVTTENAWGKTDFTDKTIAFNPEINDKGSLTIAYESSSQDSQAILFVFGNASFLDNDIVTFQGNIDFFMNTIGWMTGKKDSITIRAKNPGFGSVYLSTSQAKSIFYLTVIVIPMCFILFAVVIWARRRNL